jgi:hypothetical protein
MCVSQLNVEFLGTLHDGETVAGTDVVCNLSSIYAVLEEKHLKFSSVINNNPVETVWHKVTSGSSRAETDGWHDTLSLEATTNTIINTTGLSPAGLYYYIIINKNPSI